MYYKNCNLFKKSDPIHPILLILHKLATCTSNTLSLHADFNPKLWLSTKVPPLAPPSVSDLFQPYPPTRQLRSTPNTHTFVTPYSKRQNTGKRLFLHTGSLNTMPLGPFFLFQNHPPKLACSVTISELFFHSCGQCHCQLPITQSNCIPFMRLTLGNLSVCGCELAGAGVCIMHFTVVSIFISSLVLILY